LARPNSAPDCYTGKAGELYVYRNRKGKRVVAETLTRVPLGKRRSARCVRAKR
jgi:hypothetical protein